MNTRTVNERGVESAVGTGDDASAERIIRVRFGRTVVAQYQALAEPAAAYAAAMDRRYPGLRITNDPAPIGGPELRRMPGERLWDEAPAPT